MPSDVVVGFAFAVFGCLLCVVNGILDSYLEEGGVASGTPFGASGIELVRRVVDSGPA